MIQSHLYIYFIIQQVETSFLCPLVENADEHGMLRL